MAQESFRYWQARSIDQKQNASALMLGLSGGALGFSVSLLSGQSAYIGFAQSVMFHVHCIAQLLSIAAGVAFSLNRVLDFDLTSQIARARERNPAAQGLKDMRANARRRGRFTKKLHKCQGVSFIIGAIGFIAFAAFTYSNVLYP